MKLDQILQSDTQGNVAVPRATVLFFAWLVPLIATLSFLFGLMVGQLTGSGSVKQARREMCSVTLNVSLQTDPPSVAMLLPVDRGDRPRMDPQSLLPGSFQAIDNPVIDSIHESGGAVSRVSKQGVTLTVESDRSYWLVVSFPSPTSKRSLSREEVAGLSQYFLPIESLTKNGLHIELCHLAGKSRKISVERQDFRPMSFFNLFHGNVLATWTADKAARRA
ncbi:MAG: hypothetical protein ABL888_14410 [Pirellulaceae bacterium]